MVLSTARRDHSQNASASISAQSTPYPVQCLLVELITVMLSDNLQTRPGACKFASRQITSKGDGYRK